MGLCNQSSVVSTSGFSRQNSKVLSSETPTDFHNCFQSGIFCLQVSVISKDMLLCF